MCVHPIRSYLSIELKVAAARWSPPRRPPGGRYPGIFWVFSTILRWFIKETLSKRLCESVNFEQKITEKHTPIFFGPSGRIDSVFQFCPPESMKFKHAQCWGHPPRANMRTWRRLGAIFSRKMSPTVAYPTEINHMYIFQQGLSRKSSTDAITTITPAPVRSRSISAIGIQIFQYVS